MEVGIAVALGFALGVVAVVSFMGLVWVMAVDGKVSRRRRQIVVKQTYDTVKMADDLRRRIVRDMARERRSPFRTDF